MTYPANDLASLPASTDLRVGADPVERDLQLAYWQVQAAMRTVINIIDNSLYPKLIVDGGDETSFDTEIEDVRDELISATAEFVALFAINAATPADVTAPV